MLVNFPIYILKFMSNHSQHSIIDHNFFRHVFFLLMEGCSQ